MGLARIEIRPTTVLKDYLHHPEQERCARELFAYQHLEWATPRLLWHGEHWLEMERLTPILDLTPDQSRKYEQPLRELLEALHDAGWWHADVSLVNVVVHPLRGPLLIDFENLMPASGSVSYDLYGARAAGVDSPWPVPGGDGVWWGGPWDVCPGKYWND